MTTPVYQAPLNGEPTQLEAVNAAGHINQLLGEHAGEIIYKGSQTQTPTGNQSFMWSASTPETDYSQPFTMSGTAIGRIEVPVGIVGNGCDLQVSLYADNGSGSPNIAAGSLVATKVSAEYLNQVSAPLGLAATSSPVLATPRDNTLFFSGGNTVTPWIVPSGNSAGDAFLSSFCANGAYLISTGGINPSSTALVGNVWTAQYAGSGVLGLPQQQPALPQPVDGQTTCVVADSTVVVTGGNTTPSSFTLTTAVWSASWDPTTGTVGSWSAQTGLPTAIVNAGSASWNDFLYVVGGTQENTSPAAPLSTVHMANVNNGQITSWALVNALPIPLYSPFVAATNGWLLVGGGVTFVGGLPRPSSAFYYAQIYSDGSLGPWQTGPSLPTLEYSQGDGTFIAVDNFIGFGTYTSEIFSVLLVSPASGPGPTWYSSSIGSLFSGPVVTVATGNGNYDVLTINFNTPVSTWATQMTPVPVVSVPLGITGLTNGSTYHLVLRQFSDTSASDYLQFGLLGGTPLPDTALTSSRYAATAWTALASGTSIPISVFDMTISGAPYHVVGETSSTDRAKTNGYWDTLLYGANGLLTGYLSSVLQPNLPLNANPTFTSGVTPWTAVNGTITQSAAETQGGFAFSGLLTPSGSGGACYCETEKIPITQTNWGSANWVLVNGWFYSPTGYSNFDLQMNWFDSSTVYLTTSSLGTTNLVANTWTQISHYCQVPTQASFGAINPVLAGTPTTSNLLYLSDVTIIQAPETVPVLTGVVQLGYNATSVQATMINQLV